MAVAHNVHQTLIRGRGRDWLYRLDVGDETWVTNGYVLFLATQAGQVREDQLKLSECLDDYRPVGTRKQWERFADGVAFIADIEEGYALCDVDLLLTQWSYEHNAKNWRVR